MVLPAPCKPAISITAGGCVFSASGTLASPIKATNSSLTILTNTWPGVRLLMTSSPCAASRTRLIKLFTTGKATSASSKAMRTSRSVSLILSSLRRPWPRIFLMVRPSRSVNTSSIGIRLSQRLHDALSKTRRLSVDYSVMRSPPERKLRS